MTFLRLSETNQERDRGGLDENGIRGDAVRPLDSGDILKGKLRNLASGCEAGGEQPDFQE